MNEELISNEVISDKIYYIRNTKVMLDRDLAMLYGVETKRINEQIKRNKMRFPEHFMFQLTAEEYENLKSQNATSSWGGSRKLPYAFSEHGILQLANVLKSERASQVSIQIIEVFVKLRDFLLTNLNWKLELEEIKKKLVSQDQNIELVFTYLDELMHQKQMNNERTKIGFKPEL
ncbi:ORF6N domain-containing protein [Flavobacterium sp. CYK-55]|uniref:ORF6N domain-containing protein n=1 Tax=Flavobacterium sp. CYK-55 TaxID=2835529 RepID=UPI001BD18E64|nr:ORF6N domain-containing protein [Flavobacterium sp. CYK-55]MBS7787829.1 ORF6N domain-containing protein [Flavobacterium sp. CYK-55]